MNASSTSVLHPSIDILAKSYAAEIIINPLNLNFRLHTWISRENWAKLWYTLRAIDQPGKGWLRFPMLMLEAITGNDEKSIYRQLQTGKKAKAFRAYKVRGGWLTVYLGGLWAVTEKKNLKNWGFVSVEKLLKIRYIRAFSTATTTQALQHKSRYAANCKLKPEYRRSYGAADPNSIIQDKKQSSLKSAVGEVPFVLHISDKKIFASKGFTAFGTSQRAISCHQGIHQKTVQRHQATAGMIKRQLCQAKVEYGWIYSSWDYDMSSYTATSTAKDEGLGYQRQGNTVHFRDGFPLGGKKHQENQWTIPADDFGNRFFKVGDKYFMAKCNIYREERELTSMRAARRRYRQKLSQCHFSKNPAAVGGDGYINHPKPAGI